MKQILIVEDDPLLNKTLSYNLTLEGYQVTSAFNKQSAGQYWQTGRYDLILLDVNLPDGSGFELCQTMQPLISDTLVIFLTANDQESDQLKGYEAGAVDYITKPFSLAALQRKISIMLKLLEPHRSAHDVYDDGWLRLDFSEQNASLNGRALSLSPMEFKMLRFFSKHPRLVLTRRQLLENLWDAEENFVDEHTLTTTVSRIRSKIETADRHYIKTIYGMGYQWLGEALQ